MKAYLSYALPDRDVAREIVDGLRGSGHKIWFDEFELTPGPGSRKEIETALDASNVMIVLVSPASMESKEVRRDIDHALLSKNFENRVLPVYLKPVRDVPWFFRTLSAVEVGTNLDTAIQEIKVKLDSFKKREER
jgi:hypothetical protein